MKNTLNYCLKDILCYWTQAGRIFIYDLLKENGILPLIEQEDGTA